MADESSTVSDRCYFPDVPLSATAGDYVHHMKDMFETLGVRIAHLPETISYEAEDIKHIYVDGKVAIENSVRTMNKLVRRDMLKVDDLKFLKCPTTAVSARVLFLESYTWASMCFVGYILGLSIGSWDALQWLMAPIFHPFNALVMAFVVPFYMHSRLRKAHWPEEEQRTEILFASVLFGVLGGYGVGNPVLFAQCAPIVTLWIAALSGYLEFRDMNRVWFVSLCMGVPYVTYVVWAGMFFEHFVPFVLFWTIFCAVLTADLQMKLGRVKRKWAGKELEQWDAAAVVLVAHFVLSQILTAVVGHEVKKTV